MAAMTGDTTNLGRHQRRLLGDMMRHDGRWPDGWRIYTAQRVVLESLMRRGLVECVDGNYQLVTP